MPHFDDMSTRTRSELTNRTQVVHSCFHPLVLNEQISSICDNLPEFIRACRFPRSKTTIKVAIRITIKKIKVYYNRPMGAREDVEEDRETEEADEDRDDMGRLSRLTGLFGIIISRSLPPPPPPPPPPPLLAELVG